MKTLRISLPRFHKHGTSAHMHHEVWRIQTKNAIIHDGGVLLYPYATTHSDRNTRIILGFKFLLLAELCCQKKRKRILLSPLHLQVCGRAPTWLFTHVTGAPHMGHVWWCPVSGFDAMPEEWRVMGKGYQIPGRYCILTVPPIHPPCSRGKGRQNGQRELTVALCCHCATRLQRRWESIPIRCYSWPPQCRDAPGSYRTLTCQHVPRAHRGEADCWGAEKKWEDRRSASSVWCTEMDERAPGSYTDDQLRLLEPAAAAHWWKWKILPTPGTLTAVCLALVCCIGSSHCPTSAVNTKQWILD